MYHIQNILWKEVSEEMFLCHKTFSGNLERNYYVEGLLIPEEELVMYLPS
jgi:hypothetical protein